MRYFLRLSYNGTPFHGWQIQPRDVSVQQTIEEALATILRHPAPLVGAGRTDTGVHAREMFAHFDTDVPLTEPERFLRGLNRLCGRDIAIHELLPVREDAHARFDATARTYKYFASLAKTPFLYPLTWQAPRSLDVESMNHAAALLLETEDFTSFAKLHSDAKTNICRVSHARWEREGEDLLVFTITADRFLRNMVRAVVGTLVDVGRGKISIDRFREIIERKDRCEAGTSMPPQALFLWKIDYPAEIFV